MKEKDLKEKQYKDFEEIISNLYVQDSLSSGQKERMDNRIYKAIEIARDASHSKNKVFSLNLFLHNLAKWQLSILVSIVFIVFTTSFVFASSNPVLDNVRSGLFVQKGVLRVVSNEEGSSVFLKSNNEDYRNVGQTPLNLTLESGEYSVFIQKSGFSTSDIHNVSLRSGKLIEESFTLSEILSSSEVKKYENEELGISMDVPQTSEVKDSVFSNETRVIEINNKNASVFISLQDTLPSLPQSNDIFERMVNGKLASFKKYEIVNSSLSLKPFLYGIYLNGLINIHDKNYFIYSESLDKENKLFDIVINSLKISKNEVVDVKSFTSNMGISFEYPNNVIVKEVNGNIFLSTSQSINAVKIYRSGKINLNDFDNSSARYIQKEINSNQALIKNVGGNFVRVVFTNGFVIEFINTEKDLDAQITFQQILDSVSFSKEQENKLLVSKSNDYFYFVNSNEKIESDLNILDLNLKFLFSDKDTEKILSGNLELYTIKNPIFKDLSPSPLDFTSNEKIEINIEEINNKKIVSLFTKKCEGDSCKFHLDKVLVLASSPTLSALNISVNSYVWIGKFEFSTTNIKLISQTQEYKDILRLLAF